MDNTTQTPTRTAYKGIHQHVTDTIIRQLEAGTVPWLKPWQGDSASFALPQNGTTGKHYQGVNIVLLWSAIEQKGFASHEWGTFKQWQANKESIRQGEKGTMIVYYDTMEKEVDGEIKNVPFLKSSYVFNRAQLQSWQPVTCEKVDFEERIPEMDIFIANTEADIYHDRIGACYLPAQDRIAMPYYAMFFDTETRSSEEAYYGVLAHELIHWTGHAKRLDRLKSKKFGDQAYAAEELIAELGAAFLCAELDITAEPKEDHASYIANWLQALKADKTMIFKVASEASKAVNYLKELQPKD